MRLLRLVLICGFGEVVEVGEVSEDDGVLEDGQVDDGWLGFIGR